MPIRASERFALFFNYTILSDRPDKDHDRSSSRLVLQTHRPTGYRASRHSRPIFIYLFTLSSSTVRATRPFRPCPLPVTRDVTPQERQCIPHPGGGDASSDAWCARALAVRACVRGVTDEMVARPMAGRPLARVRHRTTRDSAETGHATARHPAQFEPSLRVTRPGTY